MKITQKEEISNSTDDKQHLSAVVKFLLSINGDIRQSDELMTKLVQEAYKVDTFEELEEVLFYREDFKDVLLKLESIMDDITYMLTKVYKL